MVTIPEGVNIEVSESTVTVKGKNGELTQSFTPLVEIRVSGSEVDVTGETKFVNTVSSIISNMITGVTEGFTKEVKVLYAHFPVSVEVKGTEVWLKNFQGEKEPRKSKIIGQTKVSVKGQNITVSGPDKIAVGQTVANMKSATRIRDKDDRIFQDGVYEVKTGA
jgi:large subunit ribosomal protein L6